MLTVIPPLWRRASPSLLRYRRELLAVAILGVFLLILGAALKGFVPQRILVLVFGLSLFVSFTASGLLWGAAVFEPEPPQKTDSALAVIADGVVTLTRWFACVLLVCWFGLGLLFLFVALFR